MFHVKHFWCAKTNTQTFGAFFGAFFDAFRNAFCFIRSETHEFSFTMIHHEKVSFWKCTKFRSS